LWDARSGQEVNRFRGRSRWNADVAFRPGAGTLASAASDGVVELWPLDYEPESTTLKAHAALGVQSLALHADSGRVAGAGVLAAGIDDLATHKTITRLNLNARITTQAAFSPDGKLFAAGLVSGHVRVFNATTGRLVRDFPSFGPPVSALAFSGNSRFLAAGAPSIRLPGRPPPTSTDRVIVWDLATGDKVMHLSGESVEPIAVVALSADGTRLLTGTSQRVFRVWNVTTGDLLTTLTERGERFFGTTLAALSADGRLAALGHASSGSLAEPGIDLVDVETGNRTHTLAGHGRDLRALVFSPDDGRLASASDDDTVKVWDVATGQEVLSRPAPRSVVDLGFTSDGKKLIAVGRDGTTRIWQAGG
jgi:WD40 repeat protein